MTRRHSMTRWLGALGVILSLVGLVSQGMASAQTPLVETRQSADQGDASAQFYLGAMYAGGQGVPQDDAQAVAWYRKAADQGHVPAQVTLGVMYANGEGVPQDYVEAHKWRNIAASRITGDEQKRYAETRDALAKQMTPAQLAEAQKRAADWQAAFEKRQAD